MNHFFHAQERHGLPRQRRERRLADVALWGDRIVGIGDYKTAPARLVINARGLAVAPGFITPWRISLCERPSAGARENVARAEGHSFEDQVHDASACAIPRWISFGSDEASQAPEGVFLKSNPHPRAYGNFARVPGKYVREEKLLSLGEAIRRLSALPATNLGLDHRGFPKEGMFADVVVFDPATIADRASFSQPHQYAVGMKDIFVNGVQVLKDGEHTGATPGRALWGPGKVR